MAMQRWMMKMMMMIKAKPDFHPKDKSSLTSHSDSHRHVMRCLQLVALYDMHEDAAGLYSSPVPTGDVNCGEEMKICNDCRMKSSSLHGMLNQWLPSFQSC